MNFHCKKKDQKETQGSRRNYKEKSNNFDAPIIFASWINFLESTWIYGSRGLIYSSHQNILLEQRVGKKVNKRVWGQIGIIFHSKVSIGDHQIKSIKESEVRFAIFVCWLWSLNEIILLQSFYKKPKGLLWWRWVSIFDVFVQKNGLKLWTDTHTHTHTYIYIINETLCTQIFIVL